MPLNFCLRVMSNCGMLHYDRIYETARDTSIEVCVAVFYAQFTVFD